VKCRRYRVREICRILTDLSDLEKRETYAAQKVITERYEGIASSNISKWKQDSMWYFGALNDGKGAMFKINSGSQVWFPECEKRLYLDFVFRRRHRGLRTTEDWLQTRMLEHLMDAAPADWYKFRASKGWLDGFKKRHHIKLLWRNNKKNTPIAERLEDIRAFHRYLLLDLQMSGPQRCPVYGRFPADHIFHMDQVPLPFCLDVKRSLSMQGEPVFMLLPGSSGLDKRQATLQLTIRAGGAQIVRCGLIFRGQGKVISDEEKAMYMALSPYVKVYFQPSAWADESVMVAWLADFMEDITSAGIRHEVLLGMDRHGAQKTERFREMLDGYRVVPVYTPPDCTDVVAPVDHHVGAQFKRIMSRYYHAQVAKNQDSWNLPPKEGGLSASMRRQYMACWAAAAWLELKGQTSFLKSAFTSTGWLLPKDRSGDGAIKIPGVPDYTFT
jgi:hypothetical protein